MECVLRVLERCRENGGRLEREMYAGEEVGVLRMVRKYLGEYRKREEYVRYSQQERVNRERREKDERREKEMS